MKSDLSLPFTLSSTLLFALIATASSHAVVLPDGVIERQNAQEKNFVSGDGFERFDPRSLLTKDWYSKERFPNARRDTVFLPDTNISSVVRAILVIEKEDKPLPSVRYRVRIKRVAASADYHYVHTDLIEISRFNLGPARRASVAKADPDVPVAAKSEFGIGPNVTWRFAMKSIQGQRSNIDLATRHVMSDREAAAARCFEMQCLALEPVSAPKDTWKLLPRMKPNKVAFKASDGMNASTAKVADALMRRAAPDGLRAELDDMTPFQMTIVISKNVLGQDNTIDGLLHRDHMRDDAISDIWLQRRQAGPDTIEWRQQVEHWPGRN